MLTIVYRTYFQPHVFFVSSTFLAWLTSAYVEWVTRSYPVASSNINRIQTLRIFCNIGAHPLNHNLHSTLLTRSTRPYVHCESLLRHQTPPASPEPVHSNPLPHISPLHSGSSPPAAIPTTISQDCHLDRRDSVRLTAQLT